LLVMGVLVLGGCNGSKLFHSTDDKTITTDIQAKLFNDSVLKTQDIHVDSRDGVVTLSGTVGTDLEKAAVERIAQEQDGVRNVVDMLSVTAQSAATTSEPSPAAETAAAPPPAEPATTPEQTAPEHPRHARHRPMSNQDKASADLNAYTNSVAAEENTNPGPPPASAAAAVPTGPAQVATAPAAPPAAPAPAPPPAPKPQPHVEIPAGTVVTVRMIDNIDSSRNRPGEEFAASIDTPVVVGDRVVGARGGDARVRLVNAQSAGHIEGQSQLEIELISVTLNGVAYPVKSGYYAQHGASRGTRSAETIGGGAVVGALLGGLLGHGKGAAIGSIAGAGAGTAVQVSTKGQQVKVPAETKLDFTLKDPVSVAVNGSD
jgi:hypothetical protein